MKKQKNVLTVRLDPEVIELVIKEGAGSSISEKLRSIIHRGLNIEVQEINTINIINIIKKDANI